MYWVVAGAVGVAGFAGVLLSYGHSKTAYLFASFAVPLLVGIGGSSWWAEMGRSMRAALLCRHAECAILAALPDLDERLLWEHAMDVGLKAADGSIIDLSLRPQYGMLLAVTVLGALGGPIALAYWCRSKGLYYPAVVPWIQVTVDLAEITGLWLLGHRVTKRLDARCRPDCLSDACRKTQTLAPVPAKDAADAAAESMDVLTDDASDQPADAS
jgi:hypothetical protein